MKMKSSKRSYFRCATTYTDGLYKIIESSPGPVCLVVRGLDGSSCEITRILSFLNGLGYTVYFTILVSERDTLPNNGNGLVDS